MEITKPSLIRLARRAGIKSISEDSFPYIRYILNLYLEEILKISVIAKQENETKTLMEDDIITALSLMGENYAQSEYLGTSTISKN